MKSGLNSSGEAIQGQPLIFVDGTHASGHSTNFLGEETAEVPVRGRGQCPAEGVVNRENATASW